MKGQGGEEEEENADWEWQQEKPESCEMMESWKV